jgi:hypothetical protein
MVPFIAALSWLANESGASSFAKGRLAETVGTSALSFQMIAWWEIYYGPGGLFVQVLLVN